MSPVAVARPQAMEAQMSKERVEAAGLVMMVAACYVMVIPI